MGVLSVERIIAADRDPMAWSVAASRDLLRRVLRGISSDRRPRVRLGVRLAQAVKDGYMRTRPKKARDWPHKKREHPPGPPKIRLATAEEVQRSKRLATTKHAA